MLTQENEKTKGKGKGVVCADGNRGGKERNGT